MGSGVQTSQDSQFYLSKCKAFHMILVNINTDVRLHSPEPRLGEACVSFPRRGGGGASGLCALAVVMLQVYGLQKGVHRTGDNGYCGEWDGSGWEEKENFISALFTSGLFE